MKKIVLGLMLSFISVFAMEHLTIENIESKIKNENVIVDFYATWCPPCKIMGKNLKKFVEVKNPSIKVYKIDVDDQPILAQKYGIRTIPTLVYFKDGKFFKKEIGIKTVSQLKSNVKKYF